jgi:hypothetical protein
MALEACVVCSQKLDDSTMLMSERGWVCPSCQTKIQPAEVKGLLSPLAMVGVVAVVLPFFLHITSSSSVTVNGETSTRSLDYVAIAGGIVGFLAAAGALLAAVRETQRKGARVAIALIIDLLSIFHLLRGFGLL